MHQPRRWTRNDDRRLKERHFDAPTVAHPRGVRSASYFAAWHLPADDLAGYLSRKYAGRWSDIQMENVLCGEANKNEGTTGFITDIDREDPEWVRLSAVDEVPDNISELLDRLRVALVAPSTKVCMHCARAFANEYAPAEVRA